MGWRLPLRSLWRNRRRTLLSLAVIALGTAMSLFVLGFLENSRLQIQVSTVQEYGNLQVASPKLWSSQADGYNYLIPPSDASRLASLLSAEAGFRGSTSELQFSGLLGTGRETHVIRAIGIEPGNPVLDFAEHAVAGRGLEAPDTASAFVGRTLAEKLSLSIGSVVMVTLTTVDGAYNASPFTVVGIYKYSNAQFEEQVIFVPLAYAQRLLNTASVDRIVVALDRIQGTDSVAARLSTALGAEGIPLTPRTWDDLSPFYRQLASYFNALFAFLSLAISILVFFIILQVQTLAFLERTREIGTIRALGTTRREVFALFFSESAWLAILGSGVGVAVGALFVAAFNAAGIQWLPPGTIEKFTLGARLEGKTVLVPFAVSLAATLLSALYPAASASRLRVAEALRIE
jgi:putative ABC transport system permease protein